MTSPSTAKLAEPRIVQGPALVVAGLRSHFSFQNLGGLPALWQRFAALRARIPDQVGGVTYGVGYNIGLSGFDYIAGVEVAPGAKLPPEVVSYRVPARRYAVFWHEGHVSTVRDTFMAIFNGWLPRSGHQTAEAPVVFERYDERFDPDTGTGGFELWIPLMA